MDGVISTRVGYSGGDVPNATYRNHGTHAEAVEIVFDPARISYRDLLEFFFQIHDPSTSNRQGNDVGMSYRSAIFYTTPEQQRVALDTIADVDASGLWPGKAVTEVTPAGDFWEAEPEHQDYLQHYPTATPATSSARTGSCRAALRRADVLLAAQAPGRCAGWVPGNGQSHLALPTRTRYMNLTPFLPAKVAWAQITSQG